MRITPATPWQTQLREKQPHKAGAVHSSTPLSAALQQKNSALGRSFTLKEALNGILAGQAHQTGPLAQMRSDMDARKRTEINFKMALGQPLNEADMRALERLDPEAYKKARRIQAERELYRKQMEQCRTKQDVAELHQRKLMQFTAEADAIRSGDMPADVKAEAMDHLAKRMAACNYEYKEFTSSAQYLRLPEKRKKGEGDPMPIPVEIPNPGTAVLRAKAAAVYQKSAPPCAKHAQNDPKKKTPGTAPKRTARTA